MILLDGRNFDSNLDLSLLSFSDLEPDFFKVLKSLIASDWKDILIEVIKLLTGALGDDSKHERIVGSVVFEDFVFEFDDNIDFFNGSREESGFTEGDTVSIDVDEVFGFCEFCGALWIFLRRFADILWVDVGIVFALFGWLGLIGEFHVLGEFLDFCSFAQLWFVYEWWMNVLYEFGRC